jgi:AcrR family transcriptional regulator
MTRHKRAAERRRDLIAAARRAMLRHGAEHVQLSQVASEAGLTSGAVLYHYPDLRDLLIEAQHAGTERFYSERVAAAEAIADPAERLAVTIRSGLPVGPDDADVRLLCELGGAAGRNPVYAALLSSLYDREVAMYEVILAEGVSSGAFTLSGSARTIARNIVALEDAYGYRINARHPTIDSDVAYGLILDYARQVTGHPLPAPAAQTADSFLR